MYSLLFCFVLLIENLVFPSWKPWYLSLKNACLALVFKILGFCKRGYRSEWEVTCIAKGLLYLISGSIYRTLSLSPDYLQGACKQWSFLGFYISLCYAQIFIVVWDFLFVFVLFSPSVFNGIFIDLKKSRGKGMSQNE